MKASLAVLSALSVFSLAGLALPQVAVASSTGITDWEFQGATAQISGVTGASMTVETPSTAPYINSSDPYAASEFWPMLDDAYDSNHWAQTAAEQFSNGGRYYFFEVNNDGGDSVKFYSTGSSSQSGSVGPALGSTHTYHIYYRYGSNGAIFQGDVDGAFSGNWVYNSKWVPTGVEYEEEVHDIAYARFWGTSSDNAYGYNIYYYDANGVSHQPSLNANYDSSGNGVMSTDLYSDKLWWYDKRA